MPRRTCARPVWVVLAAIVAHAAMQAALAQEHPEPAGTPLPSYAKVYQLPGGRGLAEQMPLPNNGLPNVMLTGYWPPTNEMLRQFSPNPVQNPGGWVGADWEGRGYNIYAFFPEFPQGLGKGEGDFEVDYQDTSGDFWPFTAAYEPVAIVTFGRAADDIKWTIEWRARNLPYEMWFDDYLPPLRPTPAPPDGNNPPGYIRYSTLPMWDIVDAVNNAGLNVWAVVNELTFPGAFLCEYIAYHGMWHQGLHADPNDPLWNIAAGHIHVGSQVTLADAVAATEITVRTLTTYLDRQRKTSGDLNCDGLVNFDDISPFVWRLTDPEGYHQVFPTCPLLNGDINGDNLVNFADIDPFVALLSSA